MTAKEAKYLADSSQNVPAILEVILDAIKLKASIGGYELEIYRSIGMNLIRNVHPAGEGLLMKAGTTTMSKVYKSLKELGYSVSQDNLNERTVTISWK